LLLVFASQQIVHYKVEGFKAVSAELGQLSPL